MVRLLLKHGARLSLPSGREDAVALYVAARAGHAEVMRVLLAAGAEADGAGRDGRTALFAAAAGGRKPAVELLLAAGADVHASSKDGRTVLHAVMNTPRYSEAGEILPGQDHAGVARLLIAKGADVNAADAQGLTPLAFAAGYYGSRRDTAPLRAELVRIFLEAGARHDLRDGNGQTALHHAAERYDMEAVKALLAAGADPFVADDFGDGRTPDQMAAPYADGKAVSELLVKQMAPRIEAAKLAILAAHQNVADAILTANDAALLPWTQQRVQDTASPREKLAAQLRKLFAERPDRLRKPLAVHVRPNFAEVQLPHPTRPAPQRVCLLYIHMPPDQWRWVLVEPETVAAAERPSMMLGHTARFCMSTYQQLWKELRRPKDAGGG